MADQSTQYYVLFTILIPILTLLFHHLLKRITANPPPSNTHLHRPSLPNSPPALPFIGHLHLLTPDLPKCFQKLSTKYGPLLYLRLGAVRCLLVSSASTATEIFKTQDLLFSSRPTFAFSDELPYGSSGFFAAPYGEYWRFMKKLTTSELIAPRQIELSRAVRSREIERFLRKLLESSLKGEKVDIGAGLMKLTNNITCTMVMSTPCSDDNDDAEKIRKLIKETAEMAAKVCFGDLFAWPFKRLGFWLYGRKARDVTLQYDAILEKVMKQHEERAQGRESCEGEEYYYEDLMDILLRVYRDDKSELKLTRTNIKSFLLELFLGGTGTSMEVMQWAMAELINHPHVFNKLREEINSLVGNMRLVQESDIPNLPYLQAVMKECLRLYPALPVTFRKCRDDCSINGFDIPKDITVAINLFAIMRDPEAWDNPNEFRPERFFNVPGQKHVQYEIKGQNFNFVPFGGGRRGCPGSTLAYTMINTVIAALVQCFDWKVHGDRDDKDGNGEGLKVNMEIGPGLGLPMAHAFLCYPIVCFNPFANDRDES